MAQGFDSTEWHAAVGDLVAAKDGYALAEVMAAAIDVLVDHEGTCLLAFHRDAAPDVVHHTLEPEQRKHYLDRYLAGPYLLDPLYQLALDPQKPAICRFRDKAPDRFHSSEYYRQYCERTHLLDEVDYLVDASADTVLALVIGRRTRRFTRIDIDRLAAIEPTVSACMLEIWQRRDDVSGKDAARDVLHGRLKDCFEQFGKSVLTDREREISQLLLRGHSSKSVARELSIAPGTVMVHKRNLFAKLGISSQYQLFSLFIDDLGK